MTNKILLVLAGESFRSGGQASRERGTGNYFEKQKIGNDRYAFH